VSALSSVPQTYGIVEPDENSGMVSPIRMVLLATFGVLGLETKISTLTESAHSLLFVKIYLMVLK